MKVIITLTYLIVCDNITYRGVNMKIKFFKGLLNKINQFALQRNASRMEEKGIITNREALAIYQGKIKNQKDLYRFRSVPNNEGAKKRILRKR